MPITMLAWVAAAGGAFLVCSLLIAEYLGLETPESCPLKVRMWGRFLLVFFAGILYLMFTDM
jgi:hypothetical protein